MENKLKYLEMIQQTIGRMASNSFLLKGWAVTLIAGIFALSSKDANKAYFLLAYLPILIFWGLDAYYLNLERKYRTLFDKARKTSDKDIDFAMNVLGLEFQTSSNSYYKCLFSRTQLWFYLPLTILSTVIVFLA